MGKVGYGEGPGKRVSWIGNKKPKTGAYMRYAPVLGSNSIYEKGTSLF